MSSGGSSSGGATAIGGVDAGHVPVCPNPPLAPTQPLMQFDFEDGRANGWSYVNDGQGTQFGTGVQPVAYAIPGGRGTSQYAAHAWGVGHPQYGYISFGFSPCIDVSSVDGIAFWAKGDSMFHFTAVSPETNAIEAGGDCTDHCYDSYGSLFHLTPDWKLYAYRWSELTQVGWGAKVRFSKHIQFFAFGLAGTRDATTPFDFWVDDVTYFIGAKPTQTGGAGGSGGQSSSGGAGGQSAAGGGSP